MVPKMILSVGLDSAILVSRASLLLSRGNIVVSALSIKEAVSLFQAGDFDMVVLCPSLSQTDKKRLTCLIRACGSFIPVVSVVESAEKQDDIFSATVKQEDSDRFLAEIDRVLARRERISLRRSRNSSQGAKTIVVMTPAVQEPSSWPHPAQIKWWRSDRSTQTTR